ncbi:hypothetical protein Bca101_005458 [Brassica carinata]
MKLWVAPLSMRTITSRPLIIPRSFIVREDVNPTTELAETSATNTFTSTSASSSSHGSSRSSSSTPLA